MGAAESGARGVLYVCSSADAAGGMELFTLDLLRLSVPRWPTHLVVPEEGSLAAAARQAGAEVHVVPYRRLRRLRSLADLPAFFFGWLRLEWALLCLIRRHSIGLVHFGDNIDAFFLPAARLAGAGVVCRCNSYVPHSRLARWVLSRVTRAFSHRVLCISKATVRFHYGQSGHSHPKITLFRGGGPDPELFSPETSPYPLMSELGLPAETQVLGMVARFLPDKGHDRFLDLAEQLLRRRPSGLHFLIVGKQVAGHEAFYRQCKERIDRPPLAGHVTVVEDLALTTRAEEARLAGLYRTMDLFLHLPRCEDTFPTVILEAMACGLPVVAVDKGGIPEQVRHGETGLLISEREYGTIADTVNSLLDRPDLRAALGRAARGCFSELVGRDRLARELGAIYRPWLGGSLV